MTTLLRSERPVARKEHSCSLCNRAIEPGESYNRQTSVGDDGLYVHKDCAHCEALVKILNDIDGDWYDYYEGYGPADIAEHEPQTIRAARLKVMWTRQWRRRDGALYPIPDVRSSPGVET